MGSVEEYVPLRVSPTLEPIAICGMSCRTPGQGTSPSALWRMLLEKGAGNTTKVPKTRFNIDAHFHENMDRPGSFPCPGGYFLDGPPENFDPTFFDMTPVEAMWLDPQQRRMLEVCYEAIESAGLSLESIAGSNTGVFAASFTADYQQMTFKDHDFRHNYAATGVDTGIISARIGNIFDLRGPNSLINTACSSSVYAVHNACNSLRSRDCDSALVGGVNLILTVDQHMNTAKLGIMSPTSFCHTFDESADGYGRAEGAGALYLKRLDDAIRDGDTVRAVIRSSAINSNGKVPGYGITFPNVDGQEQVIRQAYRRAGLDPNDTAVFEVHGTGTPVGDPIEVQAVSRAMNDTRLKSKPLRLTAIKPNIGHSEAASGIFAIIKAALMVETGLLPGIAGLKNLNPNIHEDEWNVKVNKDSCEWPPGFASRRASLSSFGYGGTNAHVILENVEALVPGYKHGVPRTKADYDHTSTRPLLVTLSAHDKTTLGRNIDAHCKVADQFYLVDFAHTLNTRRSTFQQRAFAIAAEPTVVTDLVPSNFKMGSGSISGLAFIFTGQGAQWAGVGKEAIRTFPVFRETIRKLDQVLKRLPHAPDFTIEEQLTAPAEVSRINNPDVAQSTLTAVQIAIVDLLYSWGVAPKSTIGHSSGEVAAAYAAGLVSAPEAIVAAYYRGYSLVRYAQKGGSMLAVGKGVAELEPFSGRFDSNIVVACENSPNSVTLSGPVEGIHAARDMLASEQVFARELRTGMAYHSPFMQSATDSMAAFINEALERLDGLDRLWRFPERTMISTVTNKRLRRGDITPTYWTSNLVSPVLFNTGIQTLVNDKSFGNINGFLEVGPHSALAGPFKQICQGSGYTYTYVPTIVRNDENSTLSMLKTAGELYLASYPVDLVRVNQATCSYQNDPRGLIASIRKPQYIRPLPLVDLPPYQWNYEKVFWTEPRASAEYRQLTHPRHDLLGRRILGLSDHSVAWRNVLRVKDIPWLVDHKLGGSVMFPAAAHLAAAVEAVQQNCEIMHVDVTEVTARDFELKTALVIPETDAGIEIQVRLTKQASIADNVRSYSFATESWSEASGWVVHSEGTIMANNDNSEVPSTTHSVCMDELTQRHSGKRWNESFRRVGFEYGRDFASLDKIRTHGKYHHQAAGVIPLAVESGLMQGESRYILHPSTVDGLLQLVIIAIHAGLYQEMPWGVIPVRFDEVTLRFPEKAAGALGHAVAWLPERGEHARRFVSHAKLITPEGNVVVDIKGLHTQSYEAALPPSSESALIPSPYTGVVWQPDPVLNETKSLLLQEAAAANAALKVVKSLNHKLPLGSLLVLDHQGMLDETQILGVVAPTTQISLFAIGDANHDADDARIQRVASPEGLLDVSTLGLEKHDVVVFGPTEARQLLDSGSASAVKSLLGDTTALIMLTDKKGTAKLREAVDGVEVVPLPDLDHLCFLPTSKGTGKTNAKTNGVKEKAVDLVYSPNHSVRPEDLVKALEARGVRVHLRILEEIGTSPTNRLILYNPNGSLLSNADEESFESLKKIVSSGTSLLWLTSGANEGKCPTAGMVSGFLRVVREEDKMANVSVLDHDNNETFESIAGTIESVLDTGNADHADDVGVRETELWLHNQTCHISRILPNEELNMRMVGGRSQVNRKTLSKGELLKGFHDSGEMVFRSSEGLDTAIPAPNEAEVQVTHVLDFNKQDFQTASEKPKLVAGIVTKVGRATQSHLEGSPILTYCHNPYNTLVRVSEEAIVRHSPSTHDALIAGITRTLLTLQAATGSLAEKRVLLLSPSASLENSATRLAQTYGFEVAVSTSTSGRNETAELMKSHGSSLIVVAETFSIQADTIWRELPAEATFVLDCNAQEADLKSLDARPFSRGVRFLTTRIKDILISNPSAVRKSLETAIGISAQSSDESSPQALTIATLADAASVPNDTSVLKFDYGCDEVKVVPSEFDVSFSSEDVYLLVGCLGGLGRSLTSWMLDRGARRFAFVSRSGDDKPEAARLVREIIEAGGLPEVFRADASSTGDMKSVVNTITKERRIRGVVHAAMVLNDSMLPTMNLDKWQGTLRPKVEGALALSEALREHNDGLDFFVMTSSISATAGQPGQSNYAAANAFLDSLALSRNLSGQPGTSLVLPMILGVGVVAESDTLESLISRRGQYGADEREMLRGFAAAMSQPRPQATTSTVKPFEPKDSVIIMGLEPARLAASLSAAEADEMSDVTWLEQDARYNNLQSWIRAASGNIAGKSGASNAGAFIPMLYATANKDGYAAALDMTSEYITQKCSSILLISLDSIQLEGKSVGAHGLDSMIGVELRNWLFKELRLNIAFQDLLSQTLSFKGLSELVLQGLGILPGMTIGEMEEEQKRARSGIKR